MLDSPIRKQISDNVWYKLLDNISQKMWHDSSDIIEIISCEMQIKHIVATIIENNIFHDFPADISVLL